TYVEDADRLFADVTLTDWLCVPEGTVVPLTVTAIPETGTEIVTEIGSFTWTSGGAPEDVCGTDEDDDATTPPPADGGDHSDDAAQDDSTAVTPVDDSTAEDTTADGSGRSDLARTGVSLGSLLATLGLVTLAGAGALALRHRMSQR